jgi:hypothetical protein
MNELVIALLYVKPNEILRICSIFKQFHDDKINFFNNILVDREGNTILDIKLQKVPSSICNTLKLMEYIPFYKAFDGNNVCMSIITAIAKIPASSHNVRDINKFYDKFTELVNSDKLYRDPNISKRNYNLNCIAVLHACMDKLKSTD